jgi:hypothetical protein
MEAPVLLPFFDSGQLVGYLRGIADGNIGSQPAFKLSRLSGWSAADVGDVLLLGMISKGEADAIQREEERAE